jgi:hypothetical protein
VQHSSKSRRFCTFLLQSYFSLNSFFKYPPRVDFIAILPFSKGPRNISKMSKSSAPKSPPTMDAPPPYDAGPSASPRNSSDSLPIDEAGAESQPLTSDAGANATLPASEATSNPTQPGRHTEGCCNFYSQGGCCNIYSRDGCCNIYSRDGCCNFDSVGSLYLVKSMVTIVFS